MVIRGALLIAILVAESAAAQRTQTVAVRVRDYRNDSLRGMAFETGASPVTRFHLADTSFAVRVTGVHRFADGRVLLATVTEASDTPRSRLVVPTVPLPMGNAEISLFNNEGTRLGHTDVRGSVRSILGQGSDALVFIGPHTTDGSVLACSLNGIVRIAPTEAAGGSGIALDSIGPGFLYVFGVFADGSILGGEPGPRAPLPSTRGSWTDSLQLIRFSPDHRQVALLPKQVARLLPRFPTTTSRRDAAHFADFLTAQAAMRVSASALPIAAPTMARPMLASQALGTIGDRIWVIDEARWEISIRDGNGTPLSLIRLPMPARNRALPANRLAPRDSAFLLHVLSDDERRLWIQASDTPPPWLRSSAPIRWWIFDHDGEFVGSAMLPAAFRPYQIANGFVTGLLAGDGRDPRITVASFALRALK